MVVVSFFLGVGFLVLVFGLLIMLVRKVMCLISFEMFCSVSSVKLIGSRILIG